MHILYASVLAAGQSSRFGAIKQLTNINGVPMLQHSLVILVNLKRVLLAYGIQLQILLVLGCYVDEITKVIAKYCQQYGITIINNKRWKQGLSSSIHTAIHHINSTVINQPSGLLITLGDQPYINHDDLTSIVLTGMSDSKAVASSLYSNRHGENRHGENRHGENRHGENRHGEDKHNESTIKGVPAYFGQHYFAELLRLEGDQGAGKLLNNLDGVKTIQIKNLIDIDYPQQIQGFDR